MTSHDPAYNPSHQDPLAAGLLPSDERSLRNRVIEISEDSRRTAREKLYAFSQMLEALSTRPEPIPPSVLATLAHRTAKAFKFAQHHEKNELRRRYIEPKSIRTVGRSFLCMPITHGPRPVTPLC
jgi:hypothetical protein